MSIHIAEATVDPQGRIVLDHLPFRPGEKVDVVIRAHETSSDNIDNLRGSVLRYQNPFDPVFLDGEVDW